LISKLDAVQLLFTLFNIVTLLYNTGELCDFVQSRPFDYKYTRFTILPPSSE